MKNINKMCSFYVNEWHLTVMLLPHINKELEKKKQIEIISEENLQLHIDSVISRTNIKEETKSKINKIDWSQTENIQEKLTDLKENSDIIIIGNKKYIEEANKMVEQTVGNKEITIINCYEVMQFNNNMEEILKTHNKVLNTSGARDIEEIYNRCNKKEVI